MGEPKYQNYRVCYDNGNSATGTKIYELHKNCDCPDCEDRTAWKREPVNHATATTKDLSKVDEIAEFLEKWTCDDGKRYLETAFFKF